MGIKSIRSIRGYWFAILAGLLAVGWVGCGGEEALPPPVENEQPKPPEPQQPEDKYSLSIIGWTSLKLLQGQQVTLQVYYSKNNQPVGNDRVFFSIIGPPTDSTVSNSSVVTNPGGYGEVTLTAGNLLGTYEVEARAEKAKPVYWAVEIQQKEPPKPDITNLTGSFSVTSRFDIQTDFAGSKLADVLNVLNEISDDPQDPGKFVVDTVLAEVDNQAIMVVANLLRPTLNMEVNKLLMSIAPGLITTFKQLAQDFSAIARKFELVSTMSTPVSQPGHNIMTVDHTLDRIAWSLDGVKTEYTFAQLNMKQPVATGVQLTLLNGSDLTVDQHSFKLNFGAFLLVALNNLLIPKVQPGAKSIYDVLAAQIDCQSVGQTMNNTVGLGGNVFWSGACDLGVKTVANYLELEIASIDSNDTTLSLKGQSKIWDGNADGEFDTVNQGIWTGDFSLQKCQAQIVGAGNTFAGYKVK